MRRDERKGERRHRDWGSLEQVGVGVGAGQVKIGWPRERNRMGDHADVINLLAWSQQKTFPFEEAALQRPMATLRRETDCLLLRQ